MPAKPHHDTVAIINLDAYYRNITKIISYIGDSVRLMAVVKANAYGHGMVECAKTALRAGASMLAVAFASEGVKLRQAGITLPILVMGAETYDFIPDLIENNLTITLTSFPMLDELKKQITKTQHACSVHIKVDTGMGRIGISPADAEALFKKTQDTDGITIEGIYSHFSSAVREHDPFSYRQIESFKHLLNKLSNQGIKPGIIHMCNSAGTLNYPEAHFDFIRPGIMTYGLKPYPGSEQKLDLEPVLSLTSKISFIKEVPAGYAVSYGATFITRRPSRLATVPIGYSYGYNRHHSNTGTALINGIKVPVAGTVCMDQTVFDITDAGDVRVGDSITLIGRNSDAQITMEDHALLSDTINYEIVTGISGKVPRIFVPPARNGVCG